MSKRLQSVSFSAVRFTDGFWRTRRERASTVTLAHLFALLAAPEAGHIVQNLRIAAGLEDGQFEGVAWGDAWLAKWLESASVVFGETEDPELERRIDDMIKLLAQAQNPDGYLASQIDAKGKERFTDPHDHELYTMGHILTAAVTHHQVTGKDHFLSIARKIGDFIVALYAGEVPREMIHFPFNPSVIMGMVELFRETGEVKYLESAQGFVDRRGTAPRGWKESPVRPWIGGDLCQDRVPLRKENAMVGHSVLSTYLYCGAADILAERGEDELFSALKRIWKSFSKRKMFINGGACAILSGVSRRKLGGNHEDLIHEAAGEDYQLPNALSYNETCAQVGAFMWASRMANLEPRAEYADVMEQILYAGILSGVDIAGENWFYRNPLRWHGGETGPYEEKQAKYTAVRFKPGRRDICCPTNLLRTELKLGGFFYGLAKEELWVHHYAAGTLASTLPGGARVKLEQKTDYPWDGKVEIRFVEVDQEFALKLRVPEWAHGASVNVNGMDEGIACEPGSYLEIRRNWRGDDRVSLDLPMRPRLMIGNPLIEETRNQVAILNGPVLYCLESCDLPAGVPIHEVRIPRDIELTPKYEAELLGGVVTLSGRGQRIRQGDWEDKLYQEILPAEVAEIDLKFIPYFAWANREVSAMDVWLPLG